MEPKAQKRISRFLSLILRHRPETVGVELDESGWTDVDALIAAINTKDQSNQLTRQKLDFVVAENDKQRFEFNEDGTRIRASQGHSIEIELGYEPSVPPDILYHGTPEKFVDPILREGLRKQKRHHVHLSAETDTASKVGQRRGRPVVLKIDAKGMVAAGHDFFVTTNGVWLTDHVPVKFLTKPADSNEAQ